MVLVSHKYKFIFLKASGCAGTSVEAYLAQFCCDPEKYNYKMTLGQKEHIDSYGIIGSRNHIKNNKKKKWYNHIKPHQIKKMLGEDLFNSYTKIGVVRNPWNHLVSMVLHKNPIKNNIISNKKGVLAHTIRNNRHTLNKKANFFFLDSKNVLDYVIRFENLNEDTKTLLNTLNIPNSFTELPKYRCTKNVNITSDKKREYLQKYQKFYNDKTQKKIENIFKDYIRAFQYTF